MFKIFDVIFFFGVLFYLGWVFIGSTPGDRMSRTCAPIVWTGGLGEAGAEVFTSPGSPAVDWVREKTADFDYGCQYIVWRTFYASPEQIAEREQQAEAERQLTESEAEEAAVLGELGKEGAEPMDKEAEPPSDEKGTEETVDTDDPMEGGAWEQ